MAFAALTVLKWLFAFTAALFALLTLVQALRGDADAVPQVTIAGAVVFIALAAACRWAAARFIEAD